MNEKSEALEKSRSWVSLYTGAYDLLDSYNLSSAQDLGLSPEKYKRRFRDKWVGRSELMTDFDVTNISFIGMGAFLGVATSASVYSLVSFLGDWNTELGLALTAGAFATAAAAHVTEWFMYLKMNLQMKFYSRSKSIKKRGHYLNRVLELFIVQKPQKVELFSNNLLLSYALWLHEKGREFRGLGKNSSYRKHLRTANIQDFIRTKEYSMYMDIAKDMNLGIFDRKAIPRVAHTKNDIELFKKYSTIISQRKDSGSTKNSTFMEQRLEEHSLNRSITESKPFLSPTKEPSKIVSFFRGVGLDQTKGEQYPQQGISEKRSISQLSSETPVVKIADFSDEMNELSKIEKEWTEIQMDIVKVLKYPMFSDMEEPLVQKLYTDLSYAKALSTKILDNDFVRAVSTLKTTWRSLLHRAKKMQLSKFTKDERKKILLATQLMGIALNDASSVSERQSAYKKAMEQLHGLIVVPDKATAMIDQTVNRLAISESF